MGRTDTARETGSAAERPANWTKRQDGGRLEDDDAIPEVLILRQAQKRDHLK